jgi:hypothetical protein
LLRKYAPLFPGKSAKAVWGKNMNRGKRSRDNMEEKSRKKKDEEKSGGKKGCKGWINLRVWREGENEPSRRGKCVF